MPSTATRKPNSNWMKPDRPRRNEEQRLLELAFCPTPRLLHGRKQSLTHGTKPDQSHTAS